MSGPRWRGLTQTERERLVRRWLKSRMARHLSERDFEALIASTEHAIISKVMADKLTIITPRD